MDKELIQTLIDAAMEARKYSYSPYSGFMVGAAVFAEGKIYTGCNAENAAYSPGICAERNAIYKAVSEGVRRIDAVAIVGGKKDALEYAPPCGVCRQVMREYADPKRLFVIVAKSKDEYVVKTLEELMPMSFGPEML